MEKYAQIVNNRIVTILDDTDARYQSIINSIAINSYQIVEISDKLYDSYKKGSNLQYDNGIISIVGITLEQAKQEKMTAIEKYDSSDSVNSFSVNGKSAWLTPEVRGNYKTSIDAAELLGETSISLLIADIAAMLTITNAKMMLAQIQRYADACYLVTMTHKATVNALTDIYSVDSYDITSNYPPKLTFTL